MNYTEKKCYCVIKVAQGQRTTHETGKEQTVVCFMGNCMKGDTL